MPAGMTYSSLITDLESYLARNDATVVNQLPRIVMLAQQRIPREMKILGFREEVTGYFNGDTQTTGIMQKPADWRKTIAFYIGTGTGNNVHSPLYERTYEYVRTIYPNPTSTGQPIYYSDADFNHWFIAPTPSTSYPYKIVYFSTLTFLDNTTQTNWLTINAPDLLLYACLVEANAFVKTDERLPVWQQMYEQSKQALVEQELESLYDRQQIASDPQPQPHPGR